MPLRIENAPDNLLALFRRHIRTVARRDSALSTVAGAADAVLTPPISVYFLPLQGMNDSAPLSSASLAGWRSLLLAGDHTPRRTIDAGIDDDRGHAFSIGSGWPVEALFQAIATADARFQPPEAECFLRCLEAPALGLSAIWVTGDADTLVPYLGASWTAADQELPAERFIARARHIAAEVWQQMKALELEEGR